MNIFLHFPHLASYDARNLDIFDLEIHEEENYFAQAILFLRAEEVLPPAGTEGVIQDDLGKLHFKGLLMGAPSKIKDGLAEIKLIAKPHYLKKALEALQRESRKAPFWDPLWVNPDKHEDFQDIQEVRTASLYCDRKDSRLTWSDWFEGGMTLDLQDNFFEEGFEIKIIKQPLQACTIKVHVNWIQREQGVANLGPALRKAFSHSRVSTYTKKSLEKKWPEPGRRLGKSGVWVIRSQLKPFYPSAPFMPRFSHPLTIGDEKEAQKSYRLERFWFKPTLWVGWSYLQRRRETLTLTLPHAAQPLFPGEGEQRVLEFTLHDVYPEPDAYLWRPDAFYHAAAKVIFKDRIYECVCDHTSSLTFDENGEHWRFLKAFITPLGCPERSSFFLAERGYAAAEHAMERAKVELAKSARALEVSFEGPWETLKDVTTDMCLILKDPRLPGGKIKGKVTKWTFLARGETGERFVCVTLLCAVGEGVGLPQDQKGRPAYVEDAYCVTAYQAYENRIRQSPTGLSYSVDETVSPPQRPKGPLLRRIQILNGPDDQEEDIQSRHYETPRALQEALQEKATRLRLFFRDLRTKPRLDHQISLRMSPWSAPKQVSLKSIA